MAILLSKLKLSSESLNEVVGEMSAGQADAVLDFSFNQRLVDFDMSNHIRYHGFTKFMLKKMGQKLENSFGDHFIFESFNGFFQKNSHFFPLRFGDWFLWSPTFNFFQSFDDGIFMI